MAPYRGLPRQLPKPVRSGLRGGTIRRGPLRLERARRLHPEAAALLREPGSGLAFGFRFGSQKSRKRMNQGCGQLLQKGSTSLNEQIPWEAQDELLFVIVRQN